MKLFHNWCIYDQAFLGHIWCVFSCFNMCSVQIYSAIKQLLYMKSLYESHLWCHSSGITDSDHHYFCVHPWSLSEEDVRKVGECLGILRLGFATCPEQMPSSEPWEKKQKSPRDLDANLPHAGERRNFGTRAVFRHIYLDLYLSLELCWSDRSHTLQSCWCPCWCGFQSLQRDPLLQIRRDTPEQAQGRDRYAAENEEKREDFFFSCPERWSFTEFTTCPQQRAYDRACELCETGSDWKWQRSAPLPAAIIWGRHPTALSWPTTCEILCVLPELMFYGKCKSENIDPALCFNPCPLWTLLLSWAFLLPSCFGPLVWIPHQLFPPCAWRIRWAH